MSSENDPQNVSPTSPKKDAPTDVPDLTPTDKPVTVLARAAAEEKAMLESLDGDLIGEILQSLSFADKFRVASALMRTSKALSNLVRPRIEPKKRHFLATAPKFLRQVGAGDEDGAFMLLNVNDADADKSDVCEIFVGVARMGADFVAAHLEEGADAEESERGRQVLISAYTAFKAHKAFLQGLSQDPEKMKESAERLRVIALGEEWLASIPAAAQPSMLQDFDANRSVSKIETNLAYPLRDALRGCGNVYSDYQSALMQALGCMNTVQYLPDKDFDFASCARSQETLKASFRKVEDANMVLPQLYDERERLGTLIPSIAALLDSNNMLLPSVAIKHIMWHVPKSTAEETAEIMAHGAHLDDDSD